MKLFSRKSYVFILCFILGLGSMTSISAQSALPVSDEVHTGELKNGLKYYIQPNQRPSDIVELRLVLNAGSILEDEDQLGLAHFAEHMCFNGTESFPRNELVSHLQSMGIQFGADLNAYTSFDETVYILPIPTTNPENLDIGFKILQEWAGKVSFDPKDVDEERGIVLEESRTGKGAMDRMMKEFLPLMLNHSLYSKRLPIGKDEIIKNFEPEVLVRYYKDWYRPNLMSVVVVGDISVEEGERLVKKYFSELENPKNERPREFPKIEPYDGQHTLVVTDPEAPMYNFGLMFSAREKKEVVTKEDFRAQLVERLAFNMLNRRFSEKVSAGGAAFSGAYVGFDGYARNYENFSLSVSPVDNIKNAIMETIAELLRVDQYGFKASELDRAKTRYMNSAEQSVESIKDRRSSSLVSRYSQHFLNGGPLLSPHNYLDLYTELLPTITLEEINKYAQEVIESNEDYFGLVLGNGVDIKVPTNRELKDIINNAYKQKVSDIEEVEVGETLIEDVLVGGKIVKESHNKTLDYTTYELSNGIKVHVKPTELRSNEILMRGVKKGGKSKYGPEDKYNIGIGFGDMIALDLDAAGYGSMKPNDLTNFMTGKNASVSTSLGQTSSTVRGSSNIKDFETMLQLAYLKMTSLRHDKELLESNLKSTKAQISFISNMPQIGFVDTLYSVMFNNDERAGIAIPKTSDFDQISLDRVFEIYQNEFGYADGYEFVFVGNIDKQTMLPLITKYLGSLPTNKEASDVVDNGLRVIEGKHKFEYLKGSEPQSLIMVQTTKEMPYDMDKALQLSMLGDIMTNKIIEKIREDHALIYGGAMSGSASELPYSNYSLTVQMPCGPENVDKVLELLESEVQAMIKEGPTKEDLDKVKKASLEAHRKGLEENGRWASYIVDESVWEKDAKQMMNFTNRVEQITTKDIQKLLKEMWGDSNQLIAILKPEEG